MGVYDYMFAYLCVCLNVIMGFCLLVFVSLLAFVCVFMCVFLCNCVCLFVCVIVFVRGRVCVCV